MLIRRTAPLVAVLVTALTGCLKTFVPAPLGTPLDEACSTFNRTLEFPLDTFPVGLAMVPVPKGWSPKYDSSRDLQLTRIDAELNVWSGARFQFPATEPRNAIRCQIRRGDTTITMQATRLRGFNYRVDVSWDPRIDGQYFYMQLQTRYVEHLRQIRGIVEAVRFAVDTIPAARR